MILYDFRKVEQEKSSGIWTSHNVSRAPLNTTKIFKSTKYFQRGMCPFLPGGHPAVRPAWNPYSITQHSRTGSPHTLTVDDTTECSVRFFAPASNPSVLTEFSTNGNRWGTELGFLPFHWKLTGGIWKQGLAWKPVKWSLIYTNLTKEDGVFKIHLAMQYHLQWKSLFTKSLKITMNWSSCGPKPSPPTPRVRWKGNEVRAPSVARSRVWLKALPPPMRSDLLTRAH